MTLAPPVLPFSLDSPDTRKDRAEIRDLLTRCLQRTEKSNLSLRIPSPEGRMQKQPGMHYHFNPEIFLQIHGETRFVLPREETLLVPGDFCIIPAGLPHKELITRDHNGFRNMVVGFYSNSISIHFAFEASPGKPDIESILFFDAPNLPSLVAMCNQLTQAVFTRSPAGEYVIKGLLITLLASLLNYVESSADSLNRDIGKVFQAKWIIREQVSNPNLNVKMLADRMQCSPDYLSHLFHLETGEKLIHYIQRIRIQGAIYALETTSLYVSEIAWASGFSDPAYFSRVFRRFTGETPQAYRERLDRSHAMKESRPKTVYFDHQDYSPGKAVAPIEAKTRPNNPRIAPTPL